MKKNVFYRIPFLLAVSATLLGLITASDAQHVPARRSMEGGRLVIWRIPGLGNDLIVEVRVDSRLAGNITYGQHFETILAPGHHTVSVRALPQPWPREPFSIALDVKSGGLYNFTAKGGTLQLILVRS
jgi:hypothetical protein